MTTSTDALTSLKSGTQKLLMWLIPWLLMSIFTAIPSLCSDYTAQARDSGGCAKGTVESAEQCDDGNAIEGDGCSAKCCTEIPAPSLPAWFPDGVHLLTDHPGHVGIGTSSPAEKLDVVGNIHASGALISGNTVCIDGGGAGVCDGVPGGPDKITTSNGVLGIGNSSTGSFELVTVGIGTLTPNAAETSLHVRAREDNFGLLIDNDTADRGESIGLHSSTTGFSSLAKNAFFTSSGWNRFDTNFGAFVQQIEPNGDTTFFGAPPAANPIFPFTDVMTLKTSGRVGIGEFLPNEQTTLHVRARENNFGVLVDSVGANGSEIGLHSGSAGYASLVKNAYFDDVVNRWRFFNEQQGAFLQEIEPGATVRFKVGTNQSSFIDWDTAITIDPNTDLPADALVGIGKDPTVRLDVRGNVATDSVFGFSSVQVQPSPFGVFISAPVNQSMGLFTSQLERVRIDPNGNVGIGTTSPLAPLHVFTGSDAELHEDRSGFLLIGSTLGTSQNPVFNLVMDDNEIMARKFTHQLSDEFQGDPPVIGEASPLHLQAEGGDLTVHNNLAASRKFVVKDNGRVGIGTANPRKKLDVRGKIRVTDVPVWDGDAQFDLTWAAGCLGSDCDHSLDKSRVITRESSSRRYKENIEPLQEDFSKVLDLQVKRYQMKEGFGPPGAWIIGYLAEDLDEAGLGMLVSYDSEGRPDAVKYKKVALYLNEVVKRQQETVDELKALLCLDYPQAASCQ